MRTWTLFGTELPPQIRPRSSMFAWRAHCLTAECRSGTGHCHPAPETGAAGGGGGSPGGKGEDRCVGVLWATRRGKAGVRLGGAFARRFVVLWGGGGGHHSKQP